MTHEERVWELYKCFAIVQFNNHQTNMEELTGGRMGAEDYHRMAETFATAFERLTTEREERIRTDSPFENRVPYYEVTAKEG